MQDDLSGIPGLRTWLDGRYGVTTGAGNLVSLHSDLSPEKNDFNRLTAPERRPIYDSSKWIKYIGQTGLIVNMNSLRRDFKFLHNGSPHGVYAISNWTFQAAVAITFDVLSTTGAGQTGMQLILQSNVSGGRLSVIIRNAGSIVRTAALSNLLTVGNPNELPFPNTYMMSSVFTGVGVSNNQITRVHNLVNTSTDASLIGEFGIGDSESFAIGNVSSLTEYYKNGMTLIYDWTGFTDTQVLAFDTRVRNILANQLPFFA